MEAEILTDHRKPTGSPLVNHSHLQQPLLQPGIEGPSMEGAWQNVKGHVARPLPPTPHNAQLLEAAHCTRTTGHALMSKSPTGFDEGNYWTSVLPVASVMPHPARKIFTGIGPPHFITVHPSSLV